MVVNMFGKVNVYGYLLLDSHLIICFQIIQSKSMVENTMAMSLLTTWALTVVFVEMVGMT